jgi:hypothetical protein
MPERAARGGQAHFRGEIASEPRNIRRAAKAGTVPWQPRSTRERAGECGKPHGQRRACWPKLGLSTTVLLVVGVLGAVTPHAGEKNRSFLAIHSGLNFPLFAGSRGVFLRVAAENTSCSRGILFSGKNCGNCVLTSFNLSGIIVVTRQYRPPPPCLIRRRLRRPGDHGGRVDESIRGSGCFGPRARR